MKMALPVSDAALRQAAEWFVLLASGEATAQERQHWQAWRAAAPAHEQAWQQTSAAMAPLAAIPPGQAAASMHALQQGDGSRGRRRAIAQLLGLAAAGTIGWLGWRHSDRSADAVTAVGEQRTMELADGSQLQLDTGTALEIDFSDETRVLRLRRGRILVSTAPDTAPRHRPFVVRTAEGQVLALGTRFTVEQQAARTQVTVLQARVALHPRASKTAAPILEEGESARFDRRGLVEQWHARPGDAAWRAGVLVADDMELAAWVAELQRYRTEPLQCDAAVRALRISGAFPLGDTDRALAAMAATLPVRLERRTHMGTSTLLIRPL
jgi:transmembrane sensor